MSPGGVRAICAALLAAVLLCGVTTLAGDAPVLSSGEEAALLDRVPVDQRTESDLVLMFYDLQSALSQLNDMKPVTGTSPSAEQGGWNGTHSTLPAPRPRNASSILDWVPASTAATFLDLRSAVGTTLRTAGAASSRMIFELIVRPLINILKKILRMIIQEILMYFLIEFFIGLLVDIFSAFDMSPEEVALPPGKEPPAVALPSNLVSDMIAAGGWSQLPAGLRRFVKIEGLEDVLSSSSSSSSSSTIRGSHRPTSPLGTASGSAQSGPSSRRESHPSELAVSRRAQERAMNDLRAAVNAVCGPSQGCPRPLSQNAVRQLASAVCGSGQDADECAEMVDETVRRSLGASETVELPRADTAVERWGEPTDSPDALLRGIQTQWDREVVELWRLVQSPEFVLLTDGGREQVLGRGLAGVQAFLRNRERGGGGAVISLLETVNRHFAEQRSTLTTVTLATDSPVSALAVLVHSFACPVPPPLFVAGAASQSEDPVTLFSQAARHQLGGGEGMMSLRRVQNAVSLALHVTAGNGAVSVTQTKTGTGESGYLVHASMPPAAGLKHWLRAWGSDAWLAFLSAPEMLPPPWVVPEMIVDGAHTLFAAPSGPSGSQDEGGCAGSMCPVWISPVPVGTLEAVWPALYRLRCARAVQALLDGEAHPSRTPIRAEVAGLLWSVELAASRAQHNRVGGDQRTPTTRSLLQTMSSRAQNRHAMDAATRGWAGAGFSSEDAWYPQCHAGFCQTARWLVHDTQHLMDAFSEHLDGLSHPWVAGTVVASAQHTPASNENGVQNVLRQRHGAFHRVLATLRMPSYLSLPAGPLIPVLSPNDDPLQIDFHNIRQRVVAAGYAATSQKDAPWAVMRALFAVRMTHAHVPVDSVAGVCGLVGTVSESDDTEDLSSTALATFLRIVQLGLCGEQWATMLADKHIPDKVAQLLTAYTLPQRSLIPPPSATLSTSAEDQHLTSHWPEHRSEDSWVGSWLGASPAFGGWLAAARTRALPPITAGDVSRVRQAVLPLLTAEAATRVSDVGIAVMVRAVQDAWLGLGGTASTHAAALLEANSNSAATTHHHHTRTAGKPGRTMDVEVSFGVWATLQCNATTLVQLCRRVLEYRPAHAPGVSSLWELTAVLVGAGVVYGQEQELDRAEAELRELRAQWEREELGERDDTHADDTTTDTPADAAPAPPDTPSVAPGWVGLDAQRFFAVLDVDRSGMVDQMDLVMWLRRMAVEAEHATQHTRTPQHQITKAELRTQQQHRKFFGCVARGIVSAARHTVEEVDEDGDEQLSLQEFIRPWGVAKPDAASLASGGSNDEPSDRSEDTPQTGKTPHMVSTGPAVLSKFSHGLRRHCQALHMTAETLQKDGSALLETDSDASVFLEEGVEAMGSPVGDYVQEVIPLLMGKFEGPLEMQSMQIYESVTTELRDSLPVYINRTVVRTVSRSLTTALTEQLTTITLRTLAARMTKSVGSEIVSRVTQTVTRDLTMSVAVPIARALTRSPREDLHCQDCFSYYEGINQGTYEREPAPVTETFDAPSAPVPGVCSACMTSLHTDYYTGYAMAYYGEYFGRYYATWYSGRQGEGAEASKTHQGALAVTIFDALVSTD